MRPAALLARMPQEEYEPWLRRVMRHKMLPWLCRELPEAIPEQFLNTVHALCQTNARRNLALTRELLALMALLDRAGLPALAYKGPVLAQRLYGELGMRQFSDLDLLLPPDSIPEVRRVLTAAGYRRVQPHSALSERQEKAFLKDEWEYHFVSPHSVFIEIHWRLLPPEMGASALFETVWGDTQAIDLLGTRVQTLGQEDMLLFLCLHGAQHRWAQLELALNIDQLIRGSHLWYWERIRERAQAAGVARLVRLALCLAQCLFETPLPSQVEQEIKSDRTLPRLVVEAMGRLTASAPKNVWANARFDLRGRERWQDRLHYGASILTAPRAVDWDCQGRTSRPLRLLRKHLTRQKQ